MTWRYQPVYRYGTWVPDSSPLVYSMALIEVDDEGRMLTVARGGKHRAFLSMEELRNDLAEAIMAANLYRPVALSSLEVGMVFERIEG